MSISCAMLRFGEGELERRDSRLIVLRIDVATDVRDDEDVADEVVKAEMIDDRGEDEAGVLTAGDSWIDVSVALDTMITGTSFVGMVLRMCGQLPQTEAKLNDRIPVTVGDDVGNILVVAGETLAAEATEPECVRRCGRDGKRGEEGNGSGEEEGGGHDEDE
jgi:hypothetical protein